MLRQFSLEPIMAGLRDLPMIRRALDELAGNQRARWGVVAVCAIMVSWGYLVLYDAVQKEQSELVQRQRQIGRLESVASDREWVARNASIASLKAQLETRLWSADTDGLALADFQDWVTSIGREAGLPALQIRPEIDTNTNNPLGLRKMSASVSGSFDVKSLHKLMAAISRSNRLVSVDRLHVQSSPIQRFDMTMSTYLRPREAPISNAGKP